jgi:hypothetical protein
MPKAIGVVKLADVAPTAIELADAKKLMQGSDKVAKSKMACMAAWLKANPSGNDEVLASRGDKRKAYLDAWLVHNMRSKLTTNSTAIIKTTNDHADEIDEVYWWSKETMDKELGEMKSKLWRECGKLIPRADPLTGSTEDPYREFPVPRSMTRHATGSGTVVNVKSEGIGDEADLSMLNNTAADAPAIVIKTEKQTIAEIAAARIMTMKADPKPTYRKMNDYLLEAKELSVKIEGVKYSDKLAEDNLKHLAKLKSIINILDKMIQGSKYDQNAMPKLVASIEQAERVHVEIDKWAVKFGISAGSKKNRRKQ